MCDYINVAINAAKIVNIGKKMIDTYAIEDMIKKISEQINDIYFDIAKSHLKSAERSIIASRKSTEPRQEIFAAIHHLYDAFEILQPLLTKTKTYKELFFFTRTEDIIKDKMKIYFPSFKISTLIFMLYHILQQNANANDWEEKIYFYKDKVLNDFYIKYGCYARIGKRKSCVCLYTCYEYHNLNKGDECYHCYDRNYCLLKECSSCTKKCKNYIESDEIIYDDSISKITEFQYNNLNAISDKFVKQELENHHDYVCYSNEAGEIYEDYITAEYFILPQGKKYCREKELIFKQNLTNFIYNTKQSDFDVAQEILEKLIALH